ncbi:MAG: ABC transporter ATP-binding protein [Oscillospiraceae bacterium]|nr:ABC transporter ATP-binding protein [Oscillospiraceae bacterium]MBQ4547116.1 ABC transporter ATP-binding protein [Oscillospiraceae bacterium]MBQ4643831.1 ABC transporter ATP-binding protein [Oscillospiraceae bacterium]
MDILRTEGLYKTYNKGSENEVHALKPLDINIEEGVFYAIIGRSGSGKSTLLQILGGLDRPTGGKLFIEDKSIFDLPNNELCRLRRQRIGFVFQAYNLLEEHTVKENIMMPLHLDGRDIEPEFLNELVEALEISDKLDRYPDQLSGGEQQRVAIARALASKPAILLADEPTGNLDPKTGDQVLRHLKALAAQFHQTILLVTHDMEIAAMADRVIRLHNGEVIETFDNV